MPNFDPTTAAEIGNFINSVYLMYNDGKGGLTPKQIGMGGYTVHSYIIMDDFLPWKSMHEFYGIVATSDSSDESVVAMRGTVGATEWFDNIHTGLVPFPHAKGSVEAGFNRIYNSIKVVPAGWDPRLLAASQPVAGTFAEQVAGAISQHKGMQLAGAVRTQKVTVAGHSLGGALLTLYVMDNVAKNLLQTPLVYTFGCPRVGDATFVSTYNAERSVTTWRIVNTHDLVPTLPPREWSFEDVDTYVPLAENNKIKDTPGCHHAMTTYMALLNPKVYSAKDCKA